MHTPKSLLLLLPTIWLAACSSAVQEQSAETGQSAEEVQAAETAQTPQTLSTCPILKSEKWYAWLDRESVKEGPYRLNVKGEITLPNPGFEMQWSVGPIDRMHPPGLRLSLISKSLNQMTAQVITTMPVTYYMDTPIRQFRHVTIYCGQQQLAQIVDVMLTD